MKIRYLGTAAYEGVPALFCTCDVCRKSRIRGGRNLRSRSQALVNDDLLLEFNPDTVTHSLQYGLDWTKIGDCLITHSHCDHLYPEDIEMAAAGYSHPHRPLHVYAADDGYRKLLPFTEKTGGGACVTKIEPGQTFTVAEKYSVLPLWANHDPATSPVIFSIECDGKRLLYAHDTGVFPAQTWERLQQEKRYDLISFDCTGCLGLSWDWRNGHMSLKTNREVEERMRAYGLIDDKTIRVVNHFSHNGGQTYEEMLSEAHKYGFVVAYDGMEIAF